MANSVFGKAMYQNARSKKMRGRVELLSQDVAKELNTYRNFGIFHTYNDIHTEEWNDKYELVGGSKPGTPGVRSIFNKLSAVLTGTNGGFSEDVHTAMKELVLQASPDRIARNIPLLDTPDNREKIRARSGCTVRELVQASQKGYFGTAVYSYADFMYCKHLGRVPNNYLITVRRYPMPMLDSVQPRGIGKMRKPGNPGTYNEAPVPIGTMVTWFGVSGNNIKDILKYDYQMDWEEKTAGWEDIQKSGGGEDGIFNQLEAAFNPATRKAYTQGHQIPALEKLMPGSFNAGQSPYPNPWELNMQQCDKNKIYGPIDRVKKAYARGGNGLDFHHEFSLVFEYQLKAYNGINPRQAMLDLIASILSVTYTTGGFWKGGYRQAGVRQSSMFTNMALFKAHGTFTNFYDALCTDIKTFSGSVMDSIESNGGIIQTALKLANNALGMLAGGLLNKFGRPARYFAPSLISDAPVGLWHITFGNPNHPIMVMGNMILLNTEIEHSGPLGLDDFPENLKVTMKFTRGKPRDQYGIENLYMGGEDRIYTSMDKKLADMYRTAQNYKNSGNDSQMTDGVDTNVNSDADILADAQNVLRESGATITADSDDYKVSFKEDKSNDANVELDGRADLLKKQKAAAKIVTDAMKKNKDLQDIWLYYFGMSDGQNAIVAAREADKGAYDKAKTEEKPKDDQTAKDKQQTEPGQK